MSSISKPFPYIPLRSHFDANLSFVAEDMELLQSLGQNVIRLGVEWPGVMPQKGVVNETYVSEIANLIEEAYSYGIYTLVDSHQVLLPPLPFLSEKKASPFFLTKKQQNRRMS